MTLEQYGERIGNLVNDLANNSALSIIVPASNELLAKIKNRIVVDGENSNGGRIGNYSTKSGYFTREQFDRKSSFTPRGKNSRGNFANGRPRRSMYFADGYKGLRDAQGKPTGKKVLDYTGSTMLAYQQRTTDTEVIQGFTTYLSSQIRKGHEQRLSMNIYKPSPVEISEYNEQVKEGLREFNLKILGGVSG